MSGRQGKVEGGKGKLRGEKRRKNEMKWRERKGTVNEGRRERRWNGGKGKKE